MTNPADMFREYASNETTQCMQELIDKVAMLARKECELLQKVQQLEEALQWACKRLHQWSPWNNGCHFKACGECPIYKTMKKEEAE